MNGRVGVVVAGLLAGLVCASCSDDQSTAATGAEGGPCYPNNTCDTGLVCVSGLCVRLGDGAALDAPGADAGKNDVTTSDTAAPDTSKLDSAKDAAVDAPKPDLGAPDTATSDSSTCNPASCPLGCHPTEPRCKVIDPSNLSVSLMLASNVDVTLSPSANSNTINVNCDTGEIAYAAGTTPTIRPAGTGVDPTTGIAFNVVSQTTGMPSIGVFSFKSLAIAQTGVELVMLPGTNACALLTTTTIDIGGSIRANANGPLGGPGGSDASQGTGAGGDGYSNCYYCGGAGGAGFGAAGGAGGNGHASACPGGGSGGGSYGVPALTPLVGGSGGGSACKNGGGGGGALQLSAGISIVLNPAVAVQAGGAGGEGGAGPGGGGAGGAIVLEAPDVKIHGFVAANGGGGGGSGSSSNGESGREDDTPALGGTCGTTPWGGTGGAGTTPAGGNGASEYGSCYVGGGGGGAAGRVRINSLTGSATVSGTASPNTPLTFTQFAVASE